MPITLSGTAGVTFNNLSTSTVGGIGDGQTWQDVQSSRSSGVTYTNSTGKPILIVIGFANNGTAGNQNPTLVVAGVSMLYQQFDGSSFAGNTFSTIVPNGATYVYTLKGSQSIAVWRELR